MWKQNEIVTVTAFNKHKAIVKACENENHRITANLQRVKFKEARKNLRKGYYLVGEGIADLSRA